MSKIKMGDLVSIRTGKLDANAAVKDGEYPFFTTAKEISRIDNFSYEGEVVLIAGNGDLNVKYYHGKFDAYQRTYILSAKNDTELEMKYLYYFFENYLEVLRSQSIGGVIKYIKLENLTTPQVYFPSIKKQKKIVDTLDLAWSLIEKRKQQLVEMDRLVQSYYLKIINENKTNKVLLRDIVEEIVSGKSYSSNEVSEYKVLKTSAVSYSNFNPKECKNLPNEYIPKKEHLVFKGDILVSRMNTLELVGAAAYVWKDHSKLAIPDRIWKLRTSRNINNIFLWKTLNQNSVKESIRKNSSGTSGSMKNISQKKFLEIPVMIPDYKKQLVFASIVEEIEAQKKVMEQSLAEMEDNFNALMQKAFKGELFPE